MMQPSAIKMRDGALNRSEPALMLSRRHPVRSATADLTVPCALPKTGQSVRYGLVWSGLTVKPQDQDQEAQNAGHGDDGAGLRPLNPVRQTLFKCYHLAV